MVTVFSDTDGVIHVDFLEPGTTINSDCYIATLKSLKQCLRGVQKHKKNILLQHDNARPHITMEAIEKLDLTSYHAHHTVQAWRQITSIFFQN
jgi:2-C-methyl-D-erythritol 4-phosphate cytidylyltransferase